MEMLTGLMALMILFIWLFPATPFARSLHLYLVELPLRLSHQIERRHLILLAILLCSGQMLAMMGSVELAMAYAVDMSFYYDAAIGAALSAAAIHIRNGWSKARAQAGRLLAMLRPRPRSRRDRAEPNSPSRPANDDDPAGYEWLAA